MSSVGTRLIEERGPVLARDDAPPRAIARALRHLNLTLIGPDRRQLGKECRGERVRRDDHAACGDAAAVGLDQMLVTRPTRDAADARARVQRYTGCDRALEHTREVPERVIRAVAWNEAAEERILDADFLANPPTRPQL